MKILAWFLIGFCSLAIIGIIGNPDEYKVYSNVLVILFTGAIITQSVLILKHLKKEKEKEIK